MLSLNIPEQLIAHFITSCEQAEKVNVRVYSTEHSPFDNTHHSGQAYNKNGRMKAQQHIKVTIGGQPERFIGQTQDQIHTFRYLLEKAIYKNIPLKILRKDTTEDLNITDISDTVMLNVDWRTRQSFLGECPKQNIQNT